MKKILAFALVLFSTINIYAQRQEPNRQISSVKKNFRKNLKGHWVAVFYDLPSNGVYNMTQGHIDSILRTGLTFKKDSIDMLGEIVMPTLYEIDERDRDEYLSNAADFSRPFLDINKKSYLISVHCIKKYKSKYIRDQYEFLYDGKFIMINLEGVAFLLQKENAHMNKFIGKGTSAKRIKLKGSEKKLTISYQFYSEPDKITVSDQTGRLILSSDMRKTTGMINHEVPLQNVTELLFKIESSVRSSGWCIWYMAE